MATSLATLQATRTQEQIFATMLGVYQANGFPTQSWQPGGTERTRLMAFSAALASVSGDFIPAATSGGFLSFASTDWLRLTADELFAIVYNAAGFTQGNITATAATGSGPYSYTDGSLTAIFGASGNRYRVVGAGNIAAGPGSTVLVFKAEFAGAKYNDPSNSGALTLVTPLPGVTMTNPAGTYSAVAKVGSGTGTLTLGGSPTAPHQVILRIDSTGTAATAAWSYSLDGSPFVVFGTGNATNLAGTAINITLVDGGSGTSFVLGDTHTFATPGSWITSQGNDDEANLLLAQRCRNRWGSLSPIPTNSLYELLATSTPTVGSQVTQVKVLTDTVINNQVNIVVAGPAGVLPPTVVASIQSYINPRGPITDTPLVVSPSTLAVTYGGVITVRAASLAAAQGAIQTAMTNMTNAVGINGTLRIAQLIDEVMDVADVVDFAGATINGVASNLTLGSATTFVLPSLQPLAFSYVTTS